jgi:hypothetical protein
VPGLLWIVAVVLVVMWLFGFAVHATFGGLLHLLLVLAVVSILFQLVSGRRRLT